MENELIYFFPYNGLLFLYVAMTAEIPDKCQLLYKLHQFFVQTQLQVQLLPNYRLGRDDNKNPVRLCVDALIELLTLDISKSRYHYHCFNSFEETVVDTLIKSKTITDP